MKNRFLQFNIAILVFLFFGCSTSSDGNGNSTTDVVPFAPANLTGNAASTTQINLSWTDNSTNETGFKIERKSGTGIFTVVGTTLIMLQPIPIQDLRQIQHTFIECILIIHQETRLLIQMKK